MRFKVLPNFMHFDQLNGIISIQPKSYNSIGDYTFYGRVVYRVPNDVFTEILGSKMASIKLFHSLIGLSFIDTNGFVTSSFDGDLSLLDEQY